MYDATDRTFTGLAPGELHDLTINQSALNLPALVGPGMGGFGGPGTAAGTRLQVPHDNDLRDG
jgi:hypothetical protein